MQRFLVFVYGVLAYTVFFGTFLYMIGFIGNLFVPKSIDSAPQAPLATAALVNVALLAIFPHCSTASWPGPRSSAGSRGLYLPQWSAAPMCWQPARP